MDPETLRARCDTAIAVARNLNCPIVHLVIAGQEPSLQIGEADFRRIYAGRVANAIPMDGRSSWFVFEHGFCISAHVAEAYVGAAVHVTELRVAS